MKKPAFKRIVLKLSGEALQGNLGYGIDYNVLVSIARQIKEVKSLGVEMAIVIGGGNIFRAPIIWACLLLS
jgi:uridylate kinase